MRLCGLPTTFSCLSIGCVPTHLPHASMAWLLTQHTCGGSGDSACRVCMAADMPAQGSADLRVLLPQQAADERAAVKRRMRASWVPRLQAGCPTSAACLPAEQTLPARARPRSVTDSATEASCQSCCSWRTPRPHSSTALGHQIPRQPAGLGRPGARAAQVAGACTCGMQTQTRGPGLSRRCLLAHPAPRQQPPGRPSAFGAPAAGSRQLHYGSLAAGAAWPTA